MADQSLLDAQARIYAEQHGVSYAEAVSEVGARIGEASVTPDDTSPLNVGDRVQSIATRRPGEVAKIYPDRSVSVCWDDGEAPATGQGHERLPRRLLEYIPPAAHTGCAARPRSEDQPQPSSNGGQGNRVDSARLQLEATAGLLCGIKFARDQQTRLDLLVAAHTQCQGSSLFIANLYEEVRGHA